MGLDIRDRYDFADACEETLPNFHVRAYWNDMAEWYTVTVGGDLATVDVLSEAGAGDMGAVEYHVRADLYNERVDWTIGDVGITVAVIEVASGLFYYVKPDAGGDTIVDWDHPRELGEEA